MHRPPARETAEHPLTDDRAASAALLFYARLTLTDYLKKHRQNLYYQLLLSGKLNDHLADIEEQAQDMMWTLLKQMAKAEGVTEELKRRDQTAWVGAINNIQARVREIINYELIFS